MQMQQQECCCEFLSTPSARRATMPGTRSIRRMRNFYPRPPRGGRLLLLSFCFDGIFISIHALREEGDPMWPWRRISMTKFLSTPSARRATCAWASRTSSSCNFYPRPPRGGRLFAIDHHIHAECISIHALREEGDALA